MQESPAKLGTFSALEKRLANEGWVRLNSRAVSLEMQMEGMFRRLFQQCQQGQLGNGVWLEVNEGVLKDINILMNEYGGCIRQLRSIQILEESLPSENSQ